MNDELSNELGANGKINYLKNISGLWLIQEIRRNFKSEGKQYSYNDMEQLARGAKPLNFSLTLTTQVLPHQAICLKKICAFAKKRVKASPKATVQ